MANHYHVLTGGHIETHYDEAEAVADYDGIDDDPLKELVYCDDPVCIDFKPEVEHG